MSQYLERVIPVERVSEIAFEMEKIHHGTPSGIDNTVIAYEQPIRFQKDHPFKLIKPKKPIHLVIAGTGSRSSTKVTVAEVHEKWVRSPKEFDTLFQK